MSLHNLSAPTSLLQVIYRQGVWDSWVTTKADLQIDSQKQAIGVAGNVRLKLFRLNVTDKQDVQLSAGYDYTLGSLGRTLVSHTVAAQSCSVHVWNNTFG